MATDWIDIGINVHALKGYGTQKKGLCPQCSHTRKPHNQKDHCLSVNLSDGVYNCKNCGWSGKVEQDHRLPPLPRTGRETRAYKKPSNRYNPTSLTSGLIKWFETHRSISKETLVSEHIGFGRYYISDFDEEKPCVQFPFKRNGELINVKHIHFADGKKYPRQEEGAERIFYRIDHVDPEMVCITEGEIDTLSLIEVGYDSVISVPDGAPQPGSKNYDSKFAFLESAEQVLKSVKKIILAGDNDAAGTTLTNELARRLGVERCWQVSWPGDCKDANEVLVKHGKDCLKDCIEDAKPWPIAGLASFRDFERQLWDIYKNGLSRGLSTGWSNVDQFYTIIPGEMTVVTGVPGHYKSTWLSALFINMARVHGWRFSLFSPEHAPVRMAITLVQQWAGKPFDSYHGMTSDDLAEAYFKLSPYFGWILADDASPTIDYVIEHAKIEVYRRGIKGLLIDPWNQVDHSRRSHVTETEYISECLSQIKRFALNYGVHVWLVCHPTKLSKATSGDYSGKYPPPTPYDITGSANFRNKADNCLSIWRDSDNDSTDVEIHIQKVKLPEVGHIGLARLSFNKQSARFREAEADNGYYDVHEDIDV